MIKLKLERIEIFALLGCVHGIREEMLDSLQDKETPKDVREGVIEHLPTVTKLEKKIIKVINEEKKKPNCSENN